MKQLKALFAYLKALLLKLVNLKKTPAPSPVVTPTPVPVVISDPVVVKPVEPTPVVVAPPVVTPPVVVVPLNPPEPMPPDYNDRYRTSLVYGGSDDGRLFKARPGVTTYTITIPQGNDKIVVFNMARDGETFVDQKATVSLDGGAAQDVSGAGGPVLVVADSGYHYFVVTCNYEWTIQLQSRPK